MFVIVPELAFFEVEQKCVSRNTVEFSESPFWERPEIFNAIYMSSLSVWIRFWMIDSFVFVSIEDQPVIRFPFVGVDSRVLLWYQPSDDGQKLLFWGIFDDLSVYFAIFSFFDAKDRHLVFRSSASLSSVCCVSFLSRSTKVWFIKFHFSMKWSIFIFLIFGNLFSKGIVPIVDCLSIYSD